MQAAGPTSPKDPGPPWERGPGLGADTEAFVWCAGSQYTSRDASLHGPPSFPPTAPAAQLPPLFRQSAVGAGGGSDVTVGSRRIGRGATPSKARPQEASAEPPVVAPTPWHHLPSGPGPLGVSGQMGLRIRSASAPPLIRATNTPRWPPLPCLPMSLQVPPGASRSGPELVQVTHPCHGHSTPASPPGQAPVQTYFKCEVSQLGRSGLCP